MNTSFLPFPAENVSGSPSSETFPPFRTEASLLTGRGNPLFRANLADTLWRHPTAISAAAQIRVPHSISPSTESFIERWWDEASPGERVAGGIFLGLSIAAVGGLLLFGGKLLAGASLAVVVFDSEQHEVWEVLTGRRTGFVEAPIYYPQILLHAFLEGQNRDSPVAERDLLIAQADELPAYALSGNDPRQGPEILERIRHSQSSASPLGFERDLREASPFRLPSVNALRSLEPIPLRAFLTPPVYEENPRPNGLETCWDELPESARAGLGLLRRYFGNGTEVHSVSFNDQWRLVFRSCGLMQTYRTIDSEEERRSFLIQLAWRAFPLTRAESRSIETLLDHPETMTNLSPETVRNLFLYYSRRAAIHGGLHAILEAAQLGDMDPEICEVHAEGMGRLQRWFREHPFEFIEMVDETSFDFTHRADEYYLNRFLSSNIGGRGLPLVRSLLSTEMTGAAGGDWIEFTLVSPGGTTEEGEGTEDIPSISSQEEPRTLQISSDTLIRFLLGIEPEISRDSEYDDYMRQLWQRWSPILSERFLEMNRGGQYDEAYLCTHDYNQVEGILLPQTFLDLYPAIRERRSWRP